MEQAIPTLTIEEEPLQQNKSHLSSKEMLTTESGICMTEAKKTAGLPPVDTAEEDSYTTKDSSYTELKENSNN